MQQSNNLTPLTNLDNLLKEVISKTDFQAINTARNLVLNISAINIIAMPTCAPLIKTYVFSQEADSERLTNFIIKADMLLETNGFYNIFNYDFKDMLELNRFKSYNNEDKFIHKYYRLFYVMRFFTITILNNLNPIEEEGPDDE